MYTCTHCGYVQSTRTKCVSCAKQEFISAEEIQTEIQRINEMNHVQMAHLYRYAPSGHVFFNGNLPLYEAFMKRFNELGGWTPAISKQVGWR